VTVLTFALRSPRRRGLRLGKPVVEVPVAVATVDVQEVRSLLVIAATRADNAPRGIFATVSVAEVFHYGSMGRAIR